MTLVSVSHLPRDPSLVVALDGQPMPQMTRLYSGENDAVSGAPRSVSERATDQMANGVAQSRFLRNKDQSTEDINLKVDGEHYASRRTYYPPRAGELGRRQHIFDLYAPTADFVTDEEVTRVDGTRASQTHASEDGAKKVTTYGADGEVVTSELVISPRPNKWSDPILEREEHWLDDQAHTLVYQNLVNRGEQKEQQHPGHTITEWDEKQRLAKVTKTPEYDTVAGTTIVAYYPDGRVRLDASADYRMDTAKYFRPNGTLDHVLKLSSSMTDVEYYDASGTKMVLEQAWWRKEKTENGVTKTYYRLYYVTEMDANGEKAREFTYFNEDGELSTVDVYNVEVDGVKYGEVDYTYDARTHTLERALFWIGKADHHYDKEEEHKAEDKIAPISVPADDLVLHVNLDEDKLPVPPPQRGPFG
jgi:hypothetical protein